MRAVVQGLDTRDSWNRYLRMEGEHDDIRNVRRTIQWIRDEFAAAARRSERHGIARLIQIDANVIDDKTEKIPSLEDFAAEHGLEDFSQAEQIEHYQSRYGNVQPNQSRRRRLIVRQLDAIRWLEELAVQPPQPDDPVATWLNPDLAAHLEKSGIDTLRQLADRINGIGYRWAASVRAIGQGKAERIVSWMRAHEATLGLSIGEHVLKRRNALQPMELAGIVAPTTAIVPLEKLIIPASLDGRNGHNRLPQAECRIPADHDLAAVHAWIDAKGAAARQTERPASTTEFHNADSADMSDSKSVPLTHTQRAYLKEAERLLLWAVVERKTALSSMTAEDCGAYLQFLGDPKPADVWCGPRGRGKWSPLWRPFEGPLSVAARRHAVTVLKSLFSFLADTGYLQHNPWAHIRLTSAAGEPRAQQFQRRLSREQWRFLHDRLSALPDTSANRRLRFGLRLIEATSLRLSEVVTLRVDDLQCITESKQETAEPATWYVKLGSGPKPRIKRLALDDSLIDLLKVYLQSRGLHADPLHPDNQGAHLLGKAVDIGKQAPWSAPYRKAVDPKEGIAPGTLYDQLKAFFADCADVIDDSASAKKLAAASTDWLRYAEADRFLSPDHRSLDPNVC